MSKRLENKIAVVTGGSQGIGRGISDALLDAGAHVVVADLNPASDIDDWRVATANRVNWIKTDVTDMSSIQALAEQIQQSHSGVDVLVNNAGIMFEKSIDEQTESDWDLMMAVNLKGPIMLCKYLLPLLRKGVKENGSAAIVNVGSIEGYACNPNHTAYAASKGGVHGLTPAMAIDLGPQGIRVNAIAPGWIDTDLNREYVESVDDVNLAKSELAKLHPVGYIGETRDVGDVAVWLASDESRFVSGQLITVDGARTKRLSLPPIFGR
ncbi:MAG: SDR family oxidoreductase [Pseudomonadota bacterium]